MKKLGLLVIFCMLFGNATAYSATYAVDRDHSSVGFKIRHLFSYVQGSFEEFDGAINYESGKTELWKVTANVQTASINTNVKERDKHLRSADFFDAEKYPTLTFKSTKIENPTQEGGKLHGLLSIHGVEKPVVFDLKIHGVGKDPWGNVLAGFTATTTINRKDFGLTWNQALETGGVLVGEEVEITLEVEGMRKD